MGPGGFVETLLGFDAREEMRTGFRALESQDESKTQFLLRTDLRDVLSADTMIWPSVCDLRQPEWIGMNAPFWDDLAALRKTIGSRESWQDGLICLVAATWHSDVGFETEAKLAGKFVGPYLTSTVPEQRDPSWPFLGYDITDGGFISGLSNCGYGEERARLVEEWSGDLNRNHLFDDLERALQFRSITNIRVPEHEPFFVIGLWQIVETLS
jgi:hypothetical protein